jgi:hypothetical protein
MKPASILNDLEAEDNLSQHLLSFSHINKIQLYTHFLIDITL